MLKKFGRNTLRPIFIFKGLVEIKLNVVIYSNRISSNHKMFNLKNLIKDILKYYMKVLRQTLLFVHSTSASMGSIRCTSLQRRSGIRYRYWR